MNIVADIGNSQIKMAVERKGDISKVKTFRLNDYAYVKKYLKTLNCKTKPELFYSSVLDSNYDKKLIKILNSYIEKIIRFSVNLICKLDDNDEIIISTATHAPWKKDKKFSQFYQRN